MPVREWLLTVFAAAFLLLKGVEIVFHVEAWPVSNVAMFSGLRPARVIPFRSTLSVSRGGALQVATHRDFLLSEGEFAARMFPDSRVGDRCGKLVDSYNRGGGAGSAQIVRATVLVEPIKRPGVPSDAEPWVVECAVSGSTVVLAGTAAP